MPATSSASREIVRVNPNSDGDLGLERRCPRLALLITDSQQISHRSDTRKRLEMLAERFVYYADSSIRRKEQRTNERRVTSRKCRSRRGDDAARRQHARPE